MALMETLLKLKVDVSGSGNVKKLSGDLKGLEQSAAGLQTTFRNVQLASSALASSAVVAGFASIIKSSVDAGDQLNLLQQKTGIAAKSLIGLQAAAKLSELDTNVLAKGINKLNIIVSEAASGNQKSADKFKGLGVSIKDASGQVATTDVIFKRLADRFADMPDGANKAAASAALFGNKLGAEFIPFLNEGSAAMGAFTVKISDEFPARSDLFNDTIDTMKLNSQALGLEMTDKLLPSLQSILNEFNNLLNTENDFTSFSEIIKVSIQGAASVLLGFALAIKTSISSVAILGTVLGKLSVGDFGGAVKSALSIGDVVKGNITSMQNIFKDAPAPPTRRRGTNEADTSTMRGNNDGGSGTGGGKTDKANNKDKESVVKRLGLSTLEVQALINTAITEYGGRDPLGRTDVMAAILNRSRSGQYPQNIVDVVTQPGQFAGNFGLNRAQVTSSSRFSQSRYNSVLQELQDPKLMEKSITDIGGRLYFKGISEQRNMVKGVDFLRASDQNFFHGPGSISKGLNPNIVSDLLRQLAGASGGASAAADYAENERATTKKQLEEQQKLAQQKREQLASAVALSDKAQFGLDIAKATTDEERLTLQYNRDRSDRMEKYIVLQYESQGNLESENLAQAQALESLAAKIIYEKDLADIRERQLKAILDMGDALGSTVFQSSDANTAAITKFDPFSGYADGIGTMNDALNNLATSGFKGLEDAMVSLATTGKANFTDFAAAMLQDTARLIIQQLVLKQILQAVGAIGSSGSNFNGIEGFNPSMGSLSSGFSGFDPGAFSMDSLSSGLGNNIVPYAKGGVVNSPTLFKFAKGTGLMGEAGPEAILPLRRGADGNLGVAATVGGGGDVNVNVQVDATGTKAEGDPNISRQLGGIIADAVKSEIIRQKRPGGILSN